MRYIALRQKEKIRGECPPDFSFSAELLLLRPVYATRLNSAGRPVSRSIRLAIGGCVENRLPTLKPSNGATMNKCAVEGLAAIGMRLEYASSFPRALASA